MAASSQTVADGLRHLFGRLHAAIPAQGSPETMFTTWQRVVGADSTDNLAIVERIGLFSAAVQKLEAQINASRDLDATMKSAALATVSSLKVFFRVDMFHTQVFQYKGYCSPEVCGRIGMIGLSLRDEFSEPRLLKSIADEISSLLTEVSSKLEDRGMPLDLRLNLRRHIRAMQWWLANFELASVQDLIETMGSAIVISKQIEQRSASDDTQTEASRSVSTKIANAATILGRLVGLVPKIVEGADKLTTDGQHLIDAFHSTGVPHP